MGDPRAKPPDHPQAKLGLSHISPELGLEKLTGWLDMDSMFTGSTVKFVNKETHQI